MSTPPPLTLNASSRLEEAFKQFSLETEHLEMTYLGLQERFKIVRQTLEESHTRLSGKLAELDFVSRYLEAILHHISQGILFIDLNGMVTTYNVSAQKLLKVPEQELLFHSFGDRFGDTFLGFSLQEAFESKQCPQTILLSWKIEGENIECEVEPLFVSMNREAIPLDHLQESSSPIQGLLILLRNVTHVRRLQQLANHNDRLKELGELAAHLAHEIRNPLGGIKGFATILEQELKDRPDLQQMASYIVQGSDSLNHCVSQILEYARPFQLHQETVDLIQLIEEIKQLMQVDANWNVQITFLVQSPHSNVMVSVDRQLFKSALLNLFVNAVQAMPNGGSLTVTVDVKSLFVVIQVADTGTGILPENLSKIFSPFFTTKEMGNGLGLTEVHKVVQAHQGTIEVQSEIGKGTTFTIKIPLTCGE